MRGQGTECGRYVSKCNLTIRSQLRTVSVGGNYMTILNATEARSKLYTLIDEAASSHQPIVITGKRSNAVLVSEEDWNAISETLFLVSIPGMRESIKKGLATDLSECSKELEW